MKTLTISLMLALSGYTQAKSPKAVGQQRGSTYSLYETRVNCESRSVSRYALKNSEGTFRPAMRSSDLADAENGLAGYICRKHKKIAASVRLLPYAYMLKAMIVDDARNIILINRAELEEEHFPIGADERLRPLLAVTCCDETR